MSENEKEEVASTEVKSEAKSTESTESETVSTKSKKGCNNKKVHGYVVAFVTVAMILLGVVYVLEKEGRSSTGIFDSIIASQEAKVVVAVVNGTEITNSELDVSIQQFAQAAAAQGVDMTSPEAQGEVRTQSLEVLINTELLKQEAVERGIDISDEVVESRLQEIKEQIGDEELLAERMEILGIDEKQLYADIRNELLIQELLDQKFAEANLIVSEEEIAAVYDTAGGAEAGLPALEEIRAQVESQIMTSKEQEVIDVYLTELKDGADIEIK